MTTREGHHLIIDFYEAHNLDQLDYVRAALVAAADAAQAQRLEEIFHHFGSTGGVTGVVLLAESHISIHTWPEDNYAAIDVFMCGSAHPEAAIPVLVNYFKPKSKEITICRRVIKRHAKPLIAMTKGNRNA